MAFVHVGRQKGDLLRTKLLRVLEDLRRILGLTRKHRGVEVLRIMRLQERRLKCQVRVRNAVTTIEPVI